MTCARALQSFSAYLEGDLAGGQRREVDAHLRKCPRCRAAIQGIENVVHLARDPRAFPLPAGFSDRLQQRLAEHVHLPAVKQDAPLGIGTAVAHSGDHIGYFWENDREFERGVGFLEEGLRAGDACFVFGHQQANLKVLSVLRKDGFPVDRLLAEKRLAVLEGRPSGEVMLKEIGSAFQSAMAGGARMLRLLGNLGWGRRNWPEDDAILEFEARVTQAARQFPCVIVCMYDVASLSGRIILKGG
ncbi:MAG: MEDS domain-containing protein, partial [Nevskiales bacterium]